jgi:hypothetical protein
MSKQPVSRRTGFAVAFSRFILGSYFAFSSTESPEKCVDLMRTRLRAPFREVYSAPFDATQEVHPFVVRETLRSYWSLEATGYLQRQADGSTVIVGKVTDQFGRLLTIFSPFISAGGLLILSAFVRYPLPWWNVIVAAVGALVVMRYTFYSMELGLLLRIEQTLYGGSPGSG